MAAPQNKGTEYNIKNISTCVGLGSYWGEVLDVLQEIIPVYDKVNSYISLGKDSEHRNRAISGRILDGDIILDAFTDKYKNKFTHTPIENEKPSKGKIYFLFGKIILQKGYKQRNTIPILKAPNKIGGTDALMPSFAVG